MSCCRRPTPVPTPPTSTRDDTSAGATARLGRAAPGANLLLEYVGTSRLLVVGPATGHRYFFPQPGSRLAVDVRDRASLLTLPSLRPVA